MAQTTNFRRELLNLYGAGVNLIRAFAGLFYHYDCCVALISGHVFRKVKARSQTTVS